MSQISKLLSRSLARGLNRSNNFEWAVARNFAYRIRMNLDNAATMTEYPESGSIEIAGRLALAMDGLASKKTAFCVFTVPEDWLRNIPVVTCKEPWVRKGDEWHVHVDYSLCFEFAPKWTRDLLVLVERHTHGLTTEYATTWLLNSTRLLLNRHVLAERTGMKMWPKNWDFWPHGFDAAKKELEKDPTHTTTELLSAGTL